ncbi:MULTISPECIES: hypothetical protein [unclassified Arthrobacter]|uniref:hypothetical protein n=1 Tax=unclassified Arthrobacter TaxID=235627 RepID=UPI001E585F09|nr:MULTISPECIES: hypothetical protein [unclassified Arthrobacter]MCC9146488.1 hypothetical protein [Arthrobacter sp. zg-Y919]MDK1277718.1 hypothetical protein [Arthrobacter sp. zg.Y919]MDM7989782.1 hypothetical protein [Arthrobacter sp. zg-Y877]WIB02326.1 hypothetical protein QNO10_10170 [Arthrobacter sp. zg-Y919]
MSGTFWEPQADAAEEAAARKPVWTWLVTAVDLLIVLAVVPVVILVVVPFFAAYYLYLAHVLVWLAPVLLAANIGLFAWAFRSKAPGMTALSILTVLFVLVSWILLVVWGSPVTVLGFRL